MSQASIVRQIGIVVNCSSKSAQILVDRDFDIETVRLEDIFTWKKKNISSNPSILIPALIPREEFEIYGPYCNVCHIDCSLQCSKCKKVSYCSRDCQRKDKRKHKEMCIPDAS